MRSAMLAQGFRRVVVRVIQDGARAGALPVGRRRGSGMFRSLRPLSAYKTLTYAKWTNRLVNKDTGNVVADALEIADTPWRRMRGLLGREGLGPGEALLIDPCGSIHTLFMRFPIDVVFLDRNWRVLKKVERLKPWRLSSCLGARRTVELPAGALAETDVAIGSTLAVSENA